MKGRPRRSERFDLLDEALNVVVGAHARVAARRDLLGEISQAEAEFENTSIVTRGEGNRRQTRLVKERPELVAGTGVPRAADVVLTAVPQKTTRSPGVR